MRNIGWTAVVVGVLLLLAGCSKGESYDIMAPGENYSYNDSQKGTGNDLAIGTVRSRDGVRFIRLDAQSCSQVMNPKEISDIKDGTRVFLQYRYVVAPAIAEFCTDAILVEWASPLDVGGMSLLNFEECFSTYSAESLPYSDPVGIVTDWITSLEDGFLTLHYLIPQSGNKKHHFALYHSMYDKYAYYLIHNADGDKGEVSDGIVCFDVSHVLPDTDGETVKLSLVYIDLNNTEKRLTVDYCSPK